MDFQMVIRNKTIIMVVKDSVFVSLIGTKDMEKKKVLSQPVIKTSHSQKVEET